VTGRLCDSPEALEVFLEIPSPLILRLDRLGCQHQAAIDAQHDTASTALSSLVHFVRLSC
jgi:hypothetical protein